MVAVLRRTMSERTVTEELLVATPATQSPPPDLTRYEVTATGNPRRPDAVRRCRGLELEQTMRGLRAIGYRSVTSRELDADVCTTCGAQDGQRCFGPLGLVRHRERGK